MTYTLVQDSASILRDADNAHIPPDPDNRDWQEYQAWLDDGNEPNPAASPTLAAEAARWLAGGIMITSDNSGLDGVYSVVPPYNHVVNALATSIANGSGLPLSQSEAEIFDMDKNAHLFATQEVLDLAVAMRDFVHGVHLYVGGQIDSLPPNSVHLESTSLPANTDPPVVTQSGGELNCTQGGWSGVPKNFSYAWRVDWVTSVGADSPTYVLVNPDDVGHEFNCVVTASNVLGSATTSSNSVVAVTPTQGSG